MEVNLGHKWLSQKDVDAHKDDPNFNVKEPGLVIVAEIPKKNRTKRVMRFVPKSELERMMKL